MELNNLKELYAPAIDEILERCRITDEFIDKEKYQIFLATIWGNAVVDPKGAGLEEADLEILHDYLNIELQEVVGAEATLTTCFEFIVSKKGQDSLDRQKITSRHRAFLHYFARLILARDIEI